MKRFISGLFLGAALAAVFPVLADVALNATVSESKSYNTAKMRKISVTWSENGKVYVLGQAAGADGSGNDIPGTRTEIMVEVPPGSGAPTYTVEGHAKDFGSAPSCTASRAAVLATTESVKSDIGSLFSNCLN